MSRHAIPWLTIPWLALAYVVLALAAWQAWLWLPHPDVAYYTTAARQLAGGAELYEDIGDVNAPPIYWLHSLAHELATLTGLPQAKAPALLLVLFAAAVLAWCARLLPAVAQPPWILPLLAALLTFPALSSFAEREHWLLVGLLPYLFCLAAATGDGAEPTRADRWASAALAGALCALKPPFFVLPVLLPELWLAWRRRRIASLWRGEALVAAGVFLFVVALSLLLHPAYWERVLPQALTYYQGLDLPLEELLAPRGIWLPLLLLLAIAWLSFGVSGYSLLACAFSAAALAFALAFVLQAKGFAYQWLPVLVLGSAAALSLIAAVVRKSGLLLPIFLLPLLPLPLWTGYLAWQQLGGREQAWPESRALQAVLEERARGRSEPLGLFALAPEIYPLFPAVTLSGARWLNRESHLWQLDGLYRLRPAEEAGSFRAPDAQPPEEQALRERLVARFIETRPDLVAVYRGGGRPTIGGSDFSYLDYYLADPVFADAWKSYRFIQQSGDFDLYAR